MIAHRAAPTQLRQLLVCFNVNVLWRSIIHQKMSRNLKPLKEITEDQIYDNLSWGNI